jgi:hypothetical protein
MLDAVTDAFTAQLETAKLGSCGGDFGSCRARGVPYLVCNLEEF